MVKFDRLKHSLEFVSNSGSRFREKFHGVVLQDGTIDLVSDGFEDTYELIQADAVGADLPSIIQRALAGDVSVFRDQGAYFDSVGMPRTYADILNLVNDGRREFDKLPVDVRAKFGFDFDRYFATIGSKDWYDKLGIGSDNLVKEEVQPSSTSEVKSNES